MLIEKLLTILALIRIKDWLKNIVIFFPIIFSGNLILDNHINSVVLAFIVFSIISSCVYIINDIVDIEDDKIHNFKKFKKPLAANKISLQSAFIVLVLFLTLEIILLYFNSHLLKYIILYFLLNLFYSLYLKKISFVEIFLIGFLYLLRLNIGSFVIDVQTSILLSSCVFFLVIFIISIKRFVEKQFQNTNRIKKLNYSNKSILTIIILSAVIFLICSLYFFIYNKSLIVLFPLLIFIVYRYYIIALKQNKGEFPIDLVLNDKFLLFSCILLSSLSIYLYL